MAFSDKIREQMLVMCQRSCCLCRRFKSVDLEVHHIKPKAEGGADSIENAIVLCYDCHAAAGRYNPKHPKGSKFSRSELRRHRDEWIKVVKNGGRGGDEPDNEFYCRHLICLDYDAARDLLDHNATAIPFSFTAVLLNHVAEYMRSILNDELPYSWGGSSGGPGYFWQLAKHYETRQALEADFPEFRYSNSRPLRSSDFGPNGITSKFLCHCANSAAPEHLGSVVCNDGPGCGGDSIDVYYELRRPVFVFAQFKNTTSRSVSVASLTSQHHEGLAPQDLYSLNLESKTRTTPRPSLLPGESILIPELVLLTPIDRDPFEADSFTHYSLQHAQEQTIGYSSGQGDGRQKPDYLVVGPADMVTSLRVISENTTRDVAVHQFNPLNCYALSRMWLMGSCPHIFFSDSCGNWSYGGEIIVEGLNQRSQSTLITPKNAAMCRIVEMEPETTTLLGIKVNGSELLVKPILLNRGNQIEFSVCGEEEIIVTGFYNAALPLIREPIFLRQKNSLIRSYCAQLGLTN